MTQTKYYKPLLLVLALALFVGVAFSQRGLNQARAQLGLTRVDPLENAPPVLAFTTVALGGFRGLIANALWVRAMDMQDAGKYFEMVQLADWITKLEPHIAAVWVVQAWNMAYNISIKFQDFPDRWQWVRRGIELLRDEGLRYNPHETSIYRELAWFYQHKIGQNLDDAHAYFKRVWAEQMTEVLGGGRPNFAELINPTTPEARQKAAELRDKYKMDPQKMEEVDQRYGPLDWRLPETHAIYWAWVGLGKCNTDLITLRRVVFQSMQLAFQRGRLTMSKHGNLFDLEPNLDIIPNANWAYEDMMKQDPADEQQIKTAHRNFLKDAVYFLYSHNRMAEANHWFKYLGEKYPDFPLLVRSNSLPSQVSMEDYALDRLGEDAGETSQVRIRTLIDGLIGNEYIRLALGFDDQANQYAFQAKRIWQRYMDKIEGPSSVRVPLPPLDTIKTEILNRLLGPDSTLNPQLKAQLRTELRLPEGPITVPGNITSTNSPPASGQ